MARVEVEGVWGAGFRFRDQGLGPEVWDVVSQFGVWGFGHSWARLCGSGLGFRLEVLGFRMFVWALQ